VLSADIDALPRDVTLTELRPGGSVTDTTGAVMWTRQAGWIAVGQQVDIVGNLALSRVVQAGYGRHYLGTNEDEWGVIHLSTAALTDNGAGLQRFTLWQLSEDTDDPKRGAGIGVEAVRLSITGDIDTLGSRFRRVGTGAVSPPDRWNQLSWLLGAELQFSGFTGAWMIPGTVSLSFDAVTAGRWFLRGVNALKPLIFNLGDIYYGNTGGTINGRPRIFP
jgi:hypothetical protein